MTATARQTYRSERCDVCHASTTHTEHREERGQKECRHCYARLNRPAPRVGEGATYSIGSDSYAYTVSRVNASGKTIWLKKDRTRATKDSDYYSHQSYVFIPDPNAREEKATLRKDGYYRFVGSSCGSINIGSRHQHLDPSF